MKIYSFESSGLLSRGQAHTLAADALDNFGGIVATR